MARPSLGTLTVDLIAKTSAWTMGLDKAEKETIRFQRKIKWQLKEFGKTIDNAFKTATASVLAFSTALAGLTYNAMKTAEGQIDLAKQLGTTYNSLMLLKRAGQEGSYFGDLNTSLATMNRMLGEASFGLGRAVNSLNVVGLNAKELLSLNLEDRVYTIKQRMDDLNLTYEQQSGILKSLGFTASGAVDLFDKLAYSSKALKEEMKGMGIWVSDENLQRVEKFWDLWDKIKMQIQSILLTLGGLLTPYLHDLSDRLSKVIAKISLDGISFEGFKAKLMGILDVLKTIEKVLYTVFFVAMVKNIQAAFKIVNPLFEALIPQARMVFAAIFNYGSETFKLFFTGINRGLHRLAAIRIFPSVKKEEVNAAVEAAKTITTKLAERAAEFGKFTMKQILALKSYASKAMLSYTAALHSLLAPPSFFRSLTLRFKAWLATLTVAITAWLSAVTPAAVTSIAAAFKGMSVAAAVATTAFLGLLALNLYPFVKEFLGWVKDQVVAGLPTIGAVIIRALKNIVYSFKVVVLDNILRDALDMIRRIVEAMEASASGWVKKQLSSLAGVLKAADGYLATGAAGRPEELRAIQKEWDTLGNIITNLGEQNDTFSTRFKRAWNDNRNVIGFVAESLWDLGTRTLPHVMDVIRGKEGAGAVDLIKRLVASVKDTFNPQIKVDFDKSAFEGLGTTATEIKEVSATYLELLGHYDKSVAALNRYLDAQDKINKSQATGEEKTILYGHALKAYNDEMKAITIEAEKAKNIFITSDFDSLLGQYDKIQSITNSLNNTRKQIRDAFIEGKISAGEEAILLGKVAEEQARQMDDYADRFNQMLGKYDRVQAALNRYKEALKEINDAQLSSIEAMQLQALALAELHKELDSGTTFWGKWLENAKEAMHDFNTIVAGAVSSFESSFATAFENIVTGANNWRDAIADLFREVLRSIVRGIGEMIAQWITYGIIQKTVGKSVHATSATMQAAQAQAASMQAGLNAYMATAAIPIVGPIAAPGAMAAALAATQPMAAAVQALSLKGMAHDGIQSIPETGTWLLERGERVLSSKTSASLDRLLSDITAGGKGPRQHAITQNINVQGNVDRRTADQLAWITLQQAKRIDSRYARSN